MAEQMDSVLNAAIRLRSGVLNGPHDTAGLDAALLQTVGDLHRRQGLTVLLSSHDLNTVANHVERVALVLPGAFQIGPTDTVLTTESLSELYGVRVEVDRVDGHMVIFASGERQT